MGYICRQITGAVRGIESVLIAGANADELPEWVVPNDSYVRSKQADAVLDRREQRKDVRTPGIPPRGTGSADLPEPTAEDELAERRESAVKYDHGGVVLTLDVEAAPEAVAQRCRAWLEEHRDGIEYRDDADFVEFRTFQVVFDLASDGTVTGAYVRATFKDH